MPGIGVFSFKSTGTNARLHKEESDKHDSTETKQNNKTNTLPVIDPKKLRSKNCLSKIQNNNLKEAQ